MNSNGLTKLSIIIPCFNEVNCLDEVIRKVEAAPLPPWWTKELILVDDGSTDGTRKKLLKYSHRYTVILREKNGGKGAALKTGFRKAKGDFILIQDSDLEYDPNDYQALISAIDEDHPVVFGSRVLSENKRYSPVYFYGSRILTLLFNMSFGSNITDMTTCYKLFPRVVTGRLLAWKEDDFVFDAVCLTYELLKFKHTIVEVPIRYYPRSREEGKKIHWRHGVRCLMKITAIFFTRKNVVDMLKRQKKFFKYLIAGAFVYSINLAVFYFFLEVVKLHYLISAPASFLTAFFVSFFLQRHWTFKQDSSERVQTQASQYFLLQMANLCANTLFMFIFVEFLKFQPFVSQAVISFGLALVTFYVSQKFIFSSQ